VVSGVGENLGFFAERLKGELTCEPVHDGILQHYNILRTLAWGLQERCRPRSLLVSPLFLAKTYGAKSCVL
jgi:hypothetical protein